MKRGLKYVEETHYACGIIFDLPEGGESAEEVVYRLRYDWLLEKLTELMPTRKNSEVFWAVEVIDGCEIDITNKIKKELKDVEGVK